MFTCTVISLLVICAFYLADVTCKEIDVPVSMRCINCLCQAASACDSKTKWKDDVYGAFRISEDYWTQAGKPTINQMSSDDPQAFPVCATNLYCTYFILQKYMEKNQKDCNGDGKIDCDDFAAIHKLGADACNGTLPESYLGRYKYCQAYVQI